MLVTHEPSAVAHEIAPLKVVGFTPGLDAHEPISEPAVGCRQLARVEASPGGECVADLIRDLNELQLVSSAFIEENIPGQTDPDSDDRSTVT